MLVTDIEITDYRYCARRARHQANVGVTLKNRFITLFCQLDLPSDTDDTTRARAFVDDALRQLRRMPEIRSGRAALGFCDAFDARRAGTA